MSTTETTEAATTTPADVNDIVRLLLEDQWTREDELAREQAVHTKQMEEQLPMMQQILKSSRIEHGRSDPNWTPAHDRLILTRFVEGDDIEVFLTTLERLMRVYHVEETRWVAKLLPQLAGRALQAYTALSTDDALLYTEVKKAILHRYT